MNKNKAYKKVDETVLARLRDIVGEENVSVSAEDREKYSHDEVADLRHEPEAVVGVSNAEQISRIMRLAVETNVPVTPRGAGQGLSGGAVPAFGGVPETLSPAVAMFLLSIRS